MTESSGSRLRLSFDWRDPAVRSYPRLVPKLVLGLVLGVVATGLLTFFIGDADQSTQGRFFSGALAFAVSYPLCIAVVIGNIKRLRPAGPVSEEE
jgi:hypothetical protein